MSRVISIRSSNEIGAVLRTGKRYASPAVTAFIARTPEQRDRSGRVAFIAPKRLGNAIVRNRGKRLLRAAYATLPATHPGVDVILMANAASASMSMRDVAQDMQKVLSRAGLIQ